MTSYHKYYEPKENSGICVVRKKNESMDELLKRFRKKYSKSGLARELRERMAYEKPSQRKRRKRVQAQRLRDKEEEKVKENIVNLAPGGRYIVSPICCLPWGVPLPNVFAIPKAIEKYGTYPINKYKTNKIDNRIP